MTAHNQILEKILTLCAKEYGTTAADAKSARRLQPLADTRALFCVTAWETGFFEMMAIAVFLGRDHSTISYHIAQRARWHTGLKIDRIHYVNVSTIIKRDIMTEAPTYKVAYNTGARPFTLSRSAIRWLDRYGCNAIKEQISKAREDYAAIRMTKEESQHCGEDQYASDRLMAYLDGRRHDNDLVGCINALGRAAGADGCTLHIAMIGVPAYRISTGSDGRERVITPSSLYTYID